MIDWETLRNEYVRSNVSYRQLAEKYNVSENKIERMGRKENWTALRRSLPRRELPEASSLYEKNARSAKRIMDVADQILEKISESLDSLSVTDGNTIKHYTSALKELRDIKGVQSEADIREQELRLENLRKSSDRSSEPSVIEVVFNAGEEAWNE